MTLFVVIDRDLGRGDEANMILAVCRTEEIAERVIKKLNDERMEDGSRIEGVTTFIKEIEYLAE